MNTLFPIGPVYPEGFVYEADFLSLDEEQHLYKEVCNIELHKFKFQGYTANRKVASFGYDYSFEGGGLMKGKKFPAGFDFLVQRIADHFAVDASAFVELLVTEYPVGGVINWHRDAPPFDIIAGVSLMSDCTFRLRPHDKEKQTRQSVISFPVKRRSVYLMQGLSRSDWQHSITPVKQPRYSITLRTLRN